MQSVVVAGWQVSAFFGALAAMMLALTAYLCARWWGLIIGTAMLALCPPLLTFSHYMKEDASLLFGIAMVILASRVIWLTRRWYARIPAWALIAAACALATSGKYVGIMTVALPLVLVFIAPGFRWWKPICRLLLFVPLLALFLGIINYRTLNPAGLDFATVARHPDQWEILFNPSFISGLESEAQHSATEHWGLTANRPNSYAFRTAFALAEPFVGIAAVALPLVLLLTRKQGWGWELLMLAFAAFCTFILSYSIILFARYAFPITVMLQLLAAIAIARLVVALRSRPVLQITTGCLATAVIGSSLAIICSDYTHQFVADSRYALNNWARENLPLNAHVFADGYSEIEDYQMPFVRQRRDVDLRAYFILGRLPGIQYQMKNLDAYYVLCDLSYARYFEPSAKPAPANERSSALARDFYDFLLKQTPIWTSIPKRPMQGFTNPEIRVYHLTPEMAKQFSPRETAGGGVD
jgi:MFS family permease